MVAAKEAQGLSRSVRHKLLTPARFQPRLKGFGGMDLDEHHMKLLLQSLLIEARGKSQNGFASGFTAKKHAITFHTFKLHT